MLGICLGLGIHKRSISKYPLETINAMCAFSLKRLRKQSNLALRVRRGTDNAEKDIGFTRKDLDTNDLLNFCNQTNYTNRISNGNFNGTTAWSGLDVSSFNAENNVGVFTVNAQNGSIRNVLPLVNGTRYFMRAVIKANSPSVVLQIDGTHSVNHSGNGQFETLRRKFTWTGSTGNWGVRIRDGRSSNWSEIQVQEVIIIPLGSSSANPLFDLTEEELDIRFPFVASSGTASITNGNGFITTWYDQSGRNNHATQTNATNQPRVVNAGIFDNGLVFSNNQWLTIPNSNDFHIDTTVSLYSCFSFVDNSANAIFSKYETAGNHRGFAFRQSSINNFSYVHSSNGETFIINSVNLGLSLNTTYNILSTHFIAGKSFYLLGQGEVESPATNLASVFNNTLVPVSIGREQHSGLQHFSGTLHELIFVKSDIRNQYSRLNKY